MKAIFLFFLFFISVTLEGQIITTVAGNGTYGYSGNGGNATAAQLAWQMGVLADNAGNIYIGDHDNNVVRKVSSANIITNFAGNGVLGYSGDGGLATAAQLYHPSWMGFDNLGNLYIIDQNGEVIRKVDVSTGIITTITGILPPGYSGDGGPLAAAQFRSITGITFDVAGNMYISDNGNHAIRKVDALGIVTTFAGTGSPGFSGDGGQAASAQLSSPYKVVFDNNGNMYIPDHGNMRIRKVDNSGIISTYAGTGNFGYSGDGGQATSADLQYPWAIAVDDSGNLYIGDPGANVVRKVTTNGTISTYAGNGTYGNTGDGGLATSAQLGTIAGLAVDPSGNLFISIREYFNVIRKVTNCLTASVSQQPISVYLCNSGNASFSVSALNTTGFQWQVNTETGWTNLTDNSLYAGAATNVLLVTGATTSMNDLQYRCMLSNACGPIYSTAASLQVSTPASPSITISTTDTSVCSGSTVSFSASVQNGGSSPNYQWKKNGINVGTNSSTYNDHLLQNGDVISCNLSSNATCITGNTANSNSIVMLVTTPLTPGVAITASANSICFGTPVTFTSFITNGGSAPTLAWFKNGVDLSLNSSSYTDNSLTNGDVITCSVTSGSSCVTSSNATSSPIVITVTIPVSPSVSITSSANSVCRNTAVIFTASSLNGGAMPTYRWEKNGIIVGSNSNLYTENNINSGDVITCTLTSSADCATVQQVTSNPLSINIHADPLVVLDKNNSLCEGNNRVLDAGAFSSYNWNTGSTNRTITINNVGIYAVTVTDINGCTGTDSTTVTTLLPSPKRFLPEDTALCSYGNLSLKSRLAFESYLWNTGSGNYSINITQPGEYWLKVRDNKGCIGVDTIVVSPKDCLKGFFIPTAFTPNNDGKNDEMKPILLGKVREYRFHIYNRWGQLIFQTTDLSKGWDGTYKGLSQDSNVFVWTCTYQFENEPTQNKKGTFILLR